MSPTNSLAVKTLDELATRLANDSITVILIGEIFKMLIKKGLLSEHEVVARLEQIAAECMASPGAAPARAVGVVQIVRDIVADQVARKPS